MDWMNLMRFFTHQTIIVADLQYAINFVSQFNILKTLCDNAHDIIDEKIIFSMKYIFNNSTLENEY